MSRSKFDIIWEDPWDGPKKPPKATVRQLEYLADLVERAGYEPDGYDPESMNVQEASDMIQEMLGQ